MVVRSKIGKRKIWGRTSEVGRAQGPGRQVIGDPALTVLLLSQVTLDIFSHHSVTFSFLIVR